MLTISVTLFLIISALYLIIGVLTPISYRWFGTELVEKFGVGFSVASDVRAFGRTGGEIVRELPTVLALRVVVYDLFSGLYLAVGILHTLVAWFALRQRQPWALWALTFTDIVIPVSLWLALRHFSHHATPLSVADLPPYAYVPALFLPFAAGSGWLALSEA